MRRKCVPPLRFTWTCCCVLLLHPEVPYGVATPIPRLDPRARSCAELAGLGNENCCLLMRMLCVSQSRPHAGAQRAFARQDEVPVVASPVLPATTSVPGNQVRPPLNSDALAVLPELRNLRILRREVGHD
jgi:hypothetical protein